MQNRYKKEDTLDFKDALDFRVYTSQLLGADDTLVLHGGGNTSVKMKVNSEDILYVKGSGWDLSSIQRAGFAPVKLEALKKMAKLEKLSDSDMVKMQKEAMIDKKAPNPSVEAILHAIIPFKFVDHTHSDAVVTISNSKDGQKLIQRLYPNFLIVPYVMPGFILAKKIYEMSKDMNWEKCEGIILHNHGIFTFDDDAKISYDKMINAVKIGENFLNKSDFDVNKLTTLMRVYKSHESYTTINTSDIAKMYSKLGKKAVSRGVLTPEHIIRTKRYPLYLEDTNFEEAIKQYIKEYEEYFKRYAKDEVMLNPAPNYAVIKDFGVISFGKTQKEADIINDIISHTMKAVLKADELGGFVSISEKDSFEMEYWELEQAKLKKG